MATPQPNFKGKQACKDQDWPVIPPREQTDLGKQEYDEKVGEQKAVCAGCPVKSQCLVYALKVHVQGVWGGATDKERAAVRRKFSIVPEKLPTVDDYLPRPELIPVVCSEMGAGCKSRKGGRLRAAVPGDAWDPCPCGGALVRVVNYMPNKPRKARRSEAEVRATFKRCGENNGMSKMNPEKVRELRRLHKAGVKTKDLAAKYGIGRGVAYGIAVRRSWKQVA
jgi:WhiB family redox-sensing transcriptional regulator